MALSSTLHLPASPGRPDDAAHPVFWVPRVGFALLPIVAAVALARLATAVHAGSTRRPLPTGHRA